MEASVLKTLQKIRKETPRKFKDLRNISDDLIAALSENQKIGSNDSDADKYFDPLQAACETRQPKLMEIALEGIKYLIDHGYLRGNKKISFSNKSNLEESGDPKSSEKRTLMDVIIETVAKCSEEYDDGVHIQVIGVLLSAVTSQTCEVHEASLLLAVRSCFHIHLITKNLVNKTTAKAALTQMLSIVFFRMESYDARAKMDTEAALASLQRENNSKLVVPCGQAMYPQVYGNLGYKPSGGVATPFAGFNSSAATIGHVFPSILHKDAFLIFRALCKLSMKNTTDNNSTSDPIALQNKILSLELILHILEHSGPAFRSGDKFIFAIRQYLCVSLIGNCTSQITQVTGLSLQVFVALLNGFKDHLKAELEVFMTNIFLRILESENSTFDHKSRVLEVFQTICQDPSALVELFINYDCDFEAIDLFRRIIDAFAKITKNPNLNQPRTADFMLRKYTNDEQVIKLMGLEGLVMILRTLVAVGGSMMISKPGNMLNDQSPNGNVNKSTSYVDESLHSIDEDDNNNNNNNNNGINDQILSNDSNNNNVSNSNNNNINNNININGQILMQSYDRKQRNQEEIETGILKFNLSPKKGLAYLANLGHVEMTPQGVATFFHQYGEKLDKTAIGDYLGREVEYEDGFCVKVLHEYVDMLEFGQLHFVEAIRLFLSGFRLPGEAQKIDRIMEKFAERYYLQNRDIFASADMAFILAFSTIMLQTNLHNPAIREDKRMTREQFIKQNTGISSDGELPVSLLNDIYDRIAANPISLNQDEKLRKNKKEETTNPFLIFPISQDKKRSDAYNDERKEMVRASEAIFKQRRRNKNSNNNGNNNNNNNTNNNNGHNGHISHRNYFVRSQGDVAYIRPMFEVAWAPMLSVFSQMLEMHDEDEIVTLCLEGFQLSIQLSCRCDIITARDTYINSLAKFTTLEMIKEMKPKHVDGIKLLINISLTEGDYLNETWGQILRCISHLSRLQLFGNGLHTDEMFFSESPGNERIALSKKGYARRSLDLSQQSTLDPFKLFTSPTKAETTRQIEESNAEILLREIDPVFIDRIFLNSQNLSTESVLYFVNNLCQVSLEEISSSTGFKSKLSTGDVMTSPRVFSLQKLVEVADFNMHSRPRLAWTQLWSVLAIHFTTVGVHDNRALSMYAIDSLKQLSIKFLQKSELSNFNFQRLFLKPFEIIMNRSQSIEIKELILRCLDIMILACANNIRSGWRSIFSIFSTAAQNDKQEIAGIAFEITERLMSKQFDLLIYDFVELMNCLVAFASGPHTLISLSALSYLSQCADHLASGKIESALDSTSIHNNNQNNNNNNKDNSNNNNSNNTTTTSTITSTIIKKQINEDAAVFRLWWPLLLGLSTRVSDYRLQIRTRAVETLHHVLKTYGNLFSSQTWEVIYKGVLFPMIDSAKTDDAPQPHSQWPTQNPAQVKDPTSWISTTASTALTVCVNLYIQYYEQGLTTSLLPELITMFIGCINQDIETLSRLSLGILIDLILQIPVHQNSHTLPSDISSLIASKLSIIGLMTLKFDYGIAGTLLFDDKTSPLVKQVYNNLYNTSYRYERGDIIRPGGTINNHNHHNSNNYSNSNNNNMIINNHNGSVRFPLVHTPYGIGKVVDEKQSSEGKITQSIILSWGAMLYSSDVFTPVQRSGDSERSLLTPKLTKDQEWSKLSYQIMSSMVLTLDFIRAIGDVIHTHYDSWSLNDLSLLLGTLQCCYDHARCFNGDHKLRTHLRAKKFMKFRDNPSRLPHLLEQETRSAAQILVFGFRLFSEEKSGTIGNGKAKFADSILKRVILNLSDKFCILDENSLTNSDSYIKEELTAYAPPLMIALKGIADYQKDQFKRNIDWIATMISSINLCNDRSIRVCSKLVTDMQINSILVEYSKSTISN